VRPRLNVLCVTMLVLSLPGFNVHGSTQNTSSTAPNARLWEQRDVATSNLLYGAGGEAHVPAGPFKFIQEDLDGTQPKFEIEDTQGIRWKAKTGVEARSETAATRLVWAAGYFTDEDFYLPELKVDGLPTLKRGQRYVSSDGVVVGARLERKIPGEKRSPVGTGRRIRSWARQNSTG